MYGDVGSNPIETPKEILMKIICYICGDLCTDQGSDWISCCGFCSNKVKQRAYNDSEDRFMDDGFSPHSAMWRDAIEFVANIFIKSPRLSKAINKYTDECPCGIHPKACEYHR